MAKKQFVISLISGVHYIAGLFLVWFAAWIIMIIFGVQPHSISPTLDKLFGVLIFLVMWPLPLLLLGIWVIVLGRLIWLRHPQLKVSLLATGSVLLLPGLLLTFGGLSSLRAARESAARGGGILGGFGLIPLGLGIIILGIVFCGLVGLLALRKK